MQQLRGRNGRDPHLFIRPQLLLQASTHLGHGVFGGQAAYGALKLAGNAGAAQADLNFMLNSASGVGLVPEQVWDFADVLASPYGSDPETASIGFTDGQADGSAAPLTWAQAQLLRLIRDMAAGHLVDQ
jgi:glucoamylase